MIKKIHDWKHAKNVDPRTFYHVQDPTTRHLTLKWCDDVAAAWWLFERLNPGLAANFRKLPLVRLTGPEAGLQLARKSWYDRGTAEAAMAAVLGLPFPVSREERETAKTVPV